MSAFEILHVYTSKFLQVPGTAASESHLNSSTCEIGMGIHNEPGHRRVSPIPPLSELIPQLLDLLTSTTDPERSFMPFQGKDNIVLLINNLGGLSELELSGIVAETQRTLEHQGINIKRVLSGSFMVNFHRVLLPPSLYLPDKS